MVAYSFQKRFLEEIRAGVKQQTIRLHRKRHAREGEAIQLFTGPRMRPTRVGEARCLAAREVRLDFDFGVVELDHSLMITTPDELDDFAERDGFRVPQQLVGKIRPWDYMGRFWAITHPDDPHFSGVLIDWGETFRATPP